MTETESIALPDGESLALYEGAVERRDVRGWAKWKRVANDEGDTFVSVSLDGEVVRAVSWRGVDHAIALADGTVISATFVK